MINWTDFLSAEKRLILQQPKKISSLKFTEQESPVQ